jgi:putative Holliday junction resolvase
VRERQALEVLVGLPRSLSGGEGPAAEAARSYARALAQLVDVPVRLVDERLSTVSAHRSLREAGMKGRKQRSVVDQVAAVVLLQNALDQERSTGHAPGVPLDQPPGNR